jgi:hypothetical protein
MTILSALQRRAAAGYATPKTDLNICRIDRVDQRPELLLAFAKLRKSERAHALALVQQMAAKQTK